MAQQERFSTLAGRAVGVALAYCLAARLGLEFPYARSSASLVWPASGVALAAVLLWGRWMACAVFVGTVASARWVGIPLALALWFGVGNALSPLFASWLLRRAGKVNLQLDRRRDVLAFVLLGVVTGTLLGPSMGVAGLVLLAALPHAQAATAWFFWWLGDAAGVLVIAPALLTWATARPRRASWHRSLEGSVLVAALVASTLIGFGDALAHHYPLAFLPFPFLIWAALRFEAKGATGGSLVVSGVAVWATAHGVGPFSLGGLHVDLALLWAFVGTVTVAALLLSATLGERNNATRLLEQSEERFRRAFEDAPIGMALANLEGRVLQANKRLLSLLDYPLDALVELTIDDITHPDDRGRSVVERQDQEQRLLRRDGSVVWSNTSATLLGDDEGSLMLLVEDVTERKHAAEERERLQHQLARSQRLESIGQLAGGVAHDFNNLLLGILLYADIGLVDARGDSTVHEALVEIRAAARRAAELTRQLLAFGRRQPLQPVALDLTQRIEGLMTMLRRIIPANIVIDHAQSSAPCWVMADPSQVDQVIVNLCVNARDAMPAGGKLQITTGTSTIDGQHATLSPGKYGTLSITDTGVGITNEVREHIFEPFFTTKEEGTGLGLAVIYGIVRQHGGGIDVYSEPGEGTRFEIQLPAAERPGDSPRPAREPAEGGNETVLVVDDEELPRELLARVLGRAGYSVLQARDGVEGIELLREHAGDVRLVVLDMIMPKMGGAEAYARIHDLDPQMKVIVTTGYAGEQPEGFPAGVEVLRKPYEADEMLDRVRRVLDAPPA